MMSSYTSQLSTPPPGFQYYQTPMGLQMRPVMASAPAPRPQKSESVFTFHLPIKSDCVGLVIGAKGRTIKSIQSETGARVNLNQDKPLLNGIIGYFVIRGSPISVTRAAVKITEIATEAKHRNESGGTMVSSHKHQSQTVYIPLSSDADFPVLVSSAPAPQASPVSYDNQVVPSSDGDHMSYSQMASGGDEPRNDEQLDNDGSDSGDN